MPSITVMLNLFQHLKRSRNKFGMTMECGNKARQLRHVPVIFIIAGEASGDLLGADLMASLKEIQDVRFEGIGGPAMKAQGLNSLFPMEELSIMGVWGILRKLPPLLGRLRQTVETIGQMQPDVVVTIDAPEFSFRVLKQLHKLSQRPRLVHYVAPTVWAWRPGRARKISRFVDLLLCLYPFEPPYFEKYGLKTVFVGHPVGKEKRNQKPSSTPISISSSRNLEKLSDSLAFLNVRDPGKSSPYNNPFLGSRLRGNDANREDPLLCLLPGSRRSEIETLMPIFEKTVSLLQKDIPDLKVVLPTLPSMKPLVEKKVQGWPIDVHIVEGDEARNQAFQNASVALAASGTVALQLAARGLPFVIAYKLNKFNEMIARALLKTPWACMVNILLAFHTFGSGFVLNRKAKEKVKAPWIPEFLQHDCTPENLARALLKLFQDPQAREAQKQTMAEAITLLKAPPSNAAKSVLGEG
jgi:lipid-A-disaccharide synthase